MSRVYIILLSGIIFICVLAAVFFLLHERWTVLPVSSSNKKPISPTPSSKTVENPLSITYLRNQSYPGSEITIDQQLPDGENYHQYITSYSSQGLRIHALLTVPIGTKPQNGWPVILFNHGYITPQDYQTAPTVGQYATYLPVFAKNGYIVFKPDYRGHGTSEGQPQGAYYSSAYIIDDLNALASIKKYPDANPYKIGIWAHSMGGFITLHDLVIKPTDIKAAVMWSGAVGTYDQLLNWHDPSYHPSAYELSLRNKYRSQLLQEYGTPQSNPTFWRNIDPSTYISDITTPVQLDVALGDEEVPPAFSQSLRDKLQKAGKTVEYFEYPGDNHNISEHFTEAMQHSLDFFNKYLK